MVKMGLSSQNASEILGVPLGADSSSILMRYKRLSIQWHPDKHNHSNESQKKFKQVALAYKKLTMKDFQKDLDINECLSLFQQIIFRTATSNGRYNSCSESSENSDDESDDSDNDDTRDTLSKNNSRSQNAGSNPSNDLTEEEKEKRKAEKRRLKKKRQKERKRLEKEQKQNPSNNKSKKGPKSSPSSPQEIKNVINRNSSSEDENSFDPHSAFFTKVVAKKKKGSGNEQPANGSKREKGDKKSDDEQGEEVINPKVLRSRQLAIRGNEMAQMDQYTAAIQLFTEAINLEPSDFRFFGNRSYCYDRIEQYDKALRDAEKAIKLDKEWPKGYFRKGRALAGLKRFADAEKAFTQVLKLDKNCDDAVTELLRVRTHQLMDMGFSKTQSEQAIKLHGSVQTALDALLATHGDNTVSDLYITDDEDEGFSVHRPAPIPPPTSNPSDVKMDPTNPEGLTALWVGNVLPSVTEKRLNQLFSKFGQVTSVRPLPEKYCAFINFKTKESAGRAMHQLQGSEIDGQKLLIKFPDNPLTAGGGGGVGGNASITLRKPQTNGAVKQGQGRSHSRKLNS